jgi:hypothetical protein
MVEVDSQSSRHGFTTARLPILLQDQLMAWPFVVLVA